MSDESVWFSVNFHEGSLFKSRETCINKHFVFSELHLAHPVPQGLLRTTPGSRGEGCPN